MRLTRVTAICLALACGAGPDISELDGTVTVEIRLGGGWNGREAVYAHVAGFVDGLAPAGYFGGVSTHPRFRVVSSGGMVAVELRAPPLDDSRGWCGTHGWSGGRATVTISARCSAWDELSVALSHELVEVVADPRVNNAAGEVADFCEGPNGTRPLVVAGVLEQVAAYRGSDGVCFPHE